MIKVRILKENNEQLNPIQQYNLDFFSKNKWETSKNKASIMSSFSNDIELVKVLIKGIPQLSNYKIKNAIAGESYGRVFLLEGLDHILKIFSASVNVGEDMSWYRYCQAKTHGGKGRITTLPVFDTGKVETKYNPFYYVEMAKFLTIDQYVNDISMDKRSPTKDIKDLNTDFNKIREDYRMYYIPIKADAGRHPDDEELQKELKWFLERDGKAIANDLLYPVNEDGERIPGLMSKIFEFSEEETKSLIETLHHLIQDGFAFKDIYMKNVGVLEQTSKAGRPTFIIFDN